MTILKNIISCNQLKEGKIGTLSHADASPTYIQDTIRGTAGEIFLRRNDSGNFSFPEFSLQIGTYLEFEFRQLVIPSGSIQSHAILTSTNVNNFLGIRRDNLVSILASNNQGGIFYMNWNLPITLLTTQYYKFKFERTINNEVNLKIDDIDYGSQSFGSFPTGTIQFNNIGTQSTQYFNTTRFRYIDFNGLKFDFNETGNLPECYTDIAYLNT